MSILRFYEDRGWVEEAEPPKVVKPRLYRYRTDCVSSTYEQISALKAHEFSIPISVFKKRIGEYAFKKLAKRLGYDRDFKIERDWHVGYYESKYDGLPAVFCRWSGIEYIYILRE